MEEEEEGGWERKKDENNVQRGKVLIVKHVYSFLQRSADSYKVITKSESR